MKKTLVLLLALLTVGASFAACGGKAPDVTTSGTETTTASAAPVVTEETPDLTLSPFEASRFLFSPMGGFVQTPAGKVPAGWFPLPLFVSAVDAC